MASADKARMALFSISLDAGMFVETIEKRQGYKIAYNNGWLSREQIKAQGQALSKNGYG